ncbi:MAG: 2-oxoglutarate oxidoreductase [Clostridiales Family XIII bacterium]|jgi:2-oxoglutarate ferredoxin oxidoreductase subunit beta|nr:2-oxoglutarate oxidoreductase [Clostridiales Family XIII bacterium]
MNAVYTRPKTLDAAGSTYCPGCHHATANKLICEVLEELGQEKNAVAVMGVGCCANSFRYLGTDLIALPHGRPCAAASAYKKCNPDVVTFTYQGDGDLASIGLAETLMAANRGDNITVVFINNAVYAMTGGQIAPTTLIGQKTSTAPGGRIAEEYGYPLHMCELMGQLRAPKYLARVACTDVPNVRKTRASLMKAFKNQLDGKGFSMVEILSNCPTNWGMSALESIEFIENQLIPEYPLGEYRDI